MTESSFVAKHGKRAAIVHHLAEMLLVGSTAEVTGGDPLHGARFHVWLDAHGDVQTEARTAPYGVMVTMPNGYRSFYACFGREDAAGLLADAWRVRDTLRAE